LKWPSFFLTVCLFIFLAYCRSRFLRPSRILPPFLFSVPSLFFLGFRAFFLFFSRNIRRFPFWLRFIAFVDLSLHPKSFSHLRLQLALPFVEHAHNGKEGFFSRTAASGLRRKVVLLFFDFFPGPPLFRVYAWAGEFTAPPVSAKAVSEVS